MKFKTEMPVSICHAMGLLRIWWLAPAGLFLAACKNHDESPVVASSCNLSYIGSYDVDVEEPSGLSLAKDGLSLWTVSDADGGVYRTSLTGKVLERFQVPYSDLEGITTMDESHLAFLAEKDRKLVVANKDGTILEEAALPFSGNDNSGPEGLSYDEVTGQFHILRESPGEWITLNRGFELIGQSRLMFAQDYSSVSYDSERQHLWVLSDLSRSIHVLDRDARIVAAFSFDIEQMEGLAVDHINRRVYIMSDPLEKLYVFEFDLDGPTSRESNFQ